MRSYLDCIPCFLSQALRAGRLAHLTDEEIKSLLDTVGAMIEKIPMENTPPETGAVIYQLIREKTGRDDPFVEVKKKSIREALALYPDLENRISRSKDPLLTAIRLAIAGNVIDFGVNKTYDLNREIEKILHQEFAVFDYPEFKRSLNKASSILYLGDNAGESVFDRILIEEMGKPVTYVVREAPVINDVTREDAISSGLDQVAETVSSGSAAPGTILKMCSPAFRKRMEEAEMIISKGQGNYEGLSDTDLPIFYLLKVKCPVIARDIGVKEEDIILKYSHSGKPSRHEKKHEDRHHHL